MALFPGALPILSHALACLSLRFRYRSQVVAAQTAGNGTTEAAALVKKLRKESLPLVFELLKYPKSLGIDSRVADIFLDYLVRIQTYSPLKLSKQIFPGTSRLVC